jgi:hypothetical protein
MPRTVRIAPVSIRFSPDERARLERLAGQTALSAYIKAAVFSDAAPVRERNRVMADQVLLARVLGFLGTSGIAQNLRRLVADAASGSLLVDEAVAADLRSANRNIQAIYRLLLTALGKKPAEESGTEQSLSETFLSAAVGVEDRHDP